VEKIEIEFEHSKGKPLSRQAGEGEFVCSVTTSYGTRFDDPDAIKASGYRAVATSYGTRLITPMLKKHWGICSITIPVTNLLGEWQALVIPIGTNDWDQLWNAVEKRNNFRQPDGQFIGPDCPFHAMGKLMAT
jgi:hypothetical protein